MSKKVHFGWGKYPPYSAPPDVFVLCGLDTGWRCDAKNIDVTLQIDQVTCKHCQKGYESRRLLEEVEVSAEAEKPAICPDGFETVDCRHCPEREACE